MKIYVGIDGGCSGAIAAKDNGNLYLLEKLPLKADGSLDSYGLMNMIVCLRDAHDEMFVALEPAQFNPVSGKQSIASTWRAFGNVEAVLDCIQVPWQPVNPRKWQKQMFEGHTKLANQDTKDISIMVCQRLFPHVDLRPTERSRVPFSGFADALLIAEWALRNNR